MVRSQIVSGCKRLIFRAKVKSRFYAIQWFMPQCYQSVAVDFYALPLLVRRLPSRLPHNLQKLEKLPIDAFQRQGNTLHGVEELRIQIRTWQKALPVSRLLQPYSSPRRLSRAPG